ncbi:uncharacterized protein LOC143181365 [Calliopsis andreniformis]|uniref:uncharacterized protein LOC143181365 n=1 Tax=Calliopsis andreniformis TaxID=337506 RepID=UPI003FCCC6B4
MSKKFGHQLAIAPFENHVLHVRRKSDYASVAKGHRPTSDQGTLPQKADSNLITSILTSSTRHYHQETDLDFLVETSQEFLHDFLNIDIKPIISFYHSPIHIHSLTYLYSISNNHTHIHSALPPYGDYTSIYCIDSANSRSVFEEIQFIQIPLSLRSLSPSLAICDPDSKLDGESLKEWEKSLGAKSTTPSFADLETFLVNRIHTLDALERLVNFRKPKLTNSNFVRPSQSARVHTTAVFEQKCAFCSAGHYISSCPKFLENTQQRQTFVISRKLCFNCLGPPSVKACPAIPLQHHSTLHSVNRDSTATMSTTCTKPVASTSPLKYHARAPSTSNAELSPEETPALKVTSNSIVAHSQSFRSSSALLATAIINVVSRSGEYYKVRALLDQGSEVSIVSESIAQLLRLPRRSAAVPILGIGAETPRISNGIIAIKMVSNVNPQVSINFDALILPKLTAYLPTINIQSNHWPHLRGLPLADPHFSTPGRIDLILGAGVYAQIIEDGIRKGSLGPSTCTEKNNHAPVYGLQCSLDVELLGLLRGFWTQEEISIAPSSALTPEEAQCEKHFVSTHFRGRDGRFIVRLPVKQMVNNLGDTRTPALRALIRLERRFNFNPSLENAYLSFLREYRELDHIECDYVTCATGQILGNFICRSMELFAKLARLPNCELSVRHPSSLAKVSIRVRCSIEKMYRQIRIHDDDQPLQKILCRSSPREQPREYKLCTVTYGLACAPYLALRCLQQLAIEFDANYPLAAEIIRRDTYVDDVLSTASDIDAAKLKMCQLQEVLMAGGFKLRKWTSNTQRLLSDISSPDLASFTTLAVEGGEVHHTLGLLWNSKADSFNFVAPSAFISANSLTKRLVLSFISRIFEPLGWIAPITTITAKIFLQEIFLQELSKSSGQLD